MPTGYTANVPDGITFEQFVWQCARAMGALILMRDEPASAPIPDRFEPSDFSANRLKEAKSELDRLRNLTQEQAQAECDEEYAAAEASKAKRLQENKAQLAAYEAMLEKVAAWKPPTPDHLNFKDFMIDQLKKSIDFDDSRGYLQPSPPPSSTEWLAGRVASIKREISYHEKAHQEEVQRTESRNDWISALRSSLEA